MWWVRRVPRGGTRGRVRVSMIASSERADDVVLPSLLPSPRYERELVLMICPTRTPARLDRRSRGFPGMSESTRLTRGIKIMRGRVQVITSSPRPGDVIGCLMTPNGDYKHIIKIMAR